MPDESYPTHCCRHHREELNSGRRPIPATRPLRAAAACARLGWRARDIGALGSDDLAVMGRQSLTAQGVDVSAAWDVAGATSQFAVIIVDASSGKRRGWPGLRNPDGEVEDVLTYANAVAALNCRALGARGGLPTPAEVDAMLLSAPRS